MITFDFITHLMCYKMGQFLLLLLIVLMLDLLSYGFQINKYSKHCFCQVTNLLTPGFCGYTDYPLDSLLVYSKNTGIEPELIML